MTSSSHQTSGIPQGFLVAWQVEHPIAVAENTGSIPRRDRVFPLPSLWYIIILEGTTSPPPIVAELFRVSHELREHWTGVVRGARYGYLHVLKLKQD